MRVIMLNKNIPNNGMNVCWAQVFLCVAHTGAFTSKYYITQWISTNGNSTYPDVAYELFAKG